VPHAFVVAQHLAHDECLTDASVGLQRAGARPGDVTDVADVALVCRPLRAERRDEPLAVGLVSPQFLEAAVAREGSGLAFDRSPAHPSFCLLHAIDQ